MTTLIYSRPAGGHLFHARIEHDGGKRNFEALCGFEPSSAYSNSRRGHWRYVAHGALEPSEICPRCAKKVKAL